MPRTSWSHLRGFHLPLPPMSEQRAIAAVLDSIDEAIDRTESVISATERLRHAVLHEFLTRGLRGWHARSKQVPSLGTVPGDWQIARVSDVFDILDRRRAPLNSDERAKMPGDYPYYGANGVVDYIDDWIFDEPDDLVLLAEDGGHFDDFRTRPIAYRVRGKCWVNNHAHILRANDPNASSFLFHSMVNKDLRPFINGTTRSKLTQADLRRVLIGIPSTSAEMSYIAKSLDTVEGLLQHSRSHQRINGAFETGGIYRTPGRSYRCFEAKGLKSCQCLDARSKWLGVPAQRCSRQLKYTTSPRWSIENRRLPS